MNIPIETYTILVECVLAFYYFHQTLRPVYPSVWKMLGIYVCYFGLLLFTTAYTPLFPRLGIIGLFLFLCYYEYLKRPAFDAPGLATNSTNYDIQDLIASSEIVYQK